MHVNTERVAFWIAGSIPLGRTSRAVAEDDTELSDDCNVEDDNHDMRTCARVEQIRGSQNNQKRLLNERIDRNTMQYKKEGLQHPLMMVDPLGIVDVCKVFVNNVKQNGIVVPQVDAGVL
jgi:hypothetical protein